MRISALLAALALISAAQPLVIHAQDECTVALIAGSATVDGRPLLMKSRDVTNDAQEFVFGAGNPYDYISVTYAGMANQVFGGVNEVGFAILNANAWNFDDQVSGPDDDGYIILEALSSCATVADFAAIMDSTDDEGRTRPAVYGVIDASGAEPFLKPPLTFIMSMIWRTRRRRRMVIWCAPTTPIPAALTT